MWPFRRRQTEARAATLRTLGGSAEEFRRDGDGYQGRPLGAALDDADLKPHERERAVRLSRTEYRRGSAYGGLTDRFLDFVAGDGVVFRFKDPAAQAAVDRVLKNSRFHERWRRHLLRLFVDGEILWTVSAPARGEGGRPTDRVRVGRLDPLGIEEYLSTAQDADEILRVKHRAESTREPASLWVSDPEHPGYEAVALPKREPGEPTILAVGSWWRVNVVATRGAPLLLRALDKSGAIDELLESLVRKAEYVNRFWLHVTHNFPDDTNLGKDSKLKAFEAKVLAWAQTAQPGEALVTPEGVKVNVPAPELGSVDVKHIYEMALDVVLGGHGIPRMWFASGGDTNRATAAEQGTPIFRGIRSLQADVRGGLTELMRAVLYMLERAGVSGVKADAEFDVVMSDVASRDSERDVKEVSGLALACNELVTAGAMTPEERADILRRTAASKPWGEVLEGPAKKGQGAPTAGAEPGSGAMTPQEVEALLDVLRGVASGEMPAEVAVLVILAAWPALPEDAVRRMVRAYSLMPPQRAPAVPPPPQALAPEPEPVGAR